MSQQPPGPIGGFYGQHYRVLVTVRPDSRPTDYIWQIVRDTEGGKLSVRDASTAAFKTMNDAYTAGVAALSRMPRS
jgi:hypothetical protein